MCLRLNYLLCFYVIKVLYGHAEQTLFSLIEQTLSLNTVLLMLKMLVFLNVMLRHYYELLMVSLFRDPRI